ncbi:hypothetical protein D9V32_14060 [Mycetocola tolaasinivorans]|uniref:Uncharacterized protein n=1 Tax=Mycetocola tolaasinivorans TaxID=76635 RepID=A0A3L7A238_9MICO|nr:hypothetical protein D9V32_14060 [Mycetocola tolaasinivorans]
MIGPTVCPWPYVGPWEATAADRELELFLQSRDPVAVVAERSVNFKGEEKRILDAKTRAVRAVPVGFLFTQNQIDAARVAAERGL